MLHNVEKASLSYMQFCTEIHSLDSFEALSIRGMGGGNYVSTMVTLGMLKVDGWGIGYWLSSVSSSCWTLGGAGSNFRILELDSSQTSDTLRIDSWIHYIHNTGS